MKYILSFSFFVLKTYSYGTNTTFLTQCQVILLKFLLLASNWFQYPENTGHYKVLSIKDLCSVILQ